MSASRQEVATQKVPSERRGELIQSSPLSDLQSEPIQLLRPTGDCYEVRELLERRDLTGKDVTTFLRGEIATPRKLPHWKAKYETLLEEYHDRRDEIRELVSKMDTGGSRVDEHGRLVPVEQPGEDPLQNLLAAAQQPPRPLNPPLPPLPPRNNMQNLNNNNGNNGAAGDDDDVERRRLEQEQRDAAEAIARAVQRYRNAGVPEDEFILIRIPPSQQQQQQQQLGGGGGGVNHQNVRLTFRRICFAVLAVSTAFFCIMLQTLPLFRPTKFVNPYFDKLMYELLHVRHFDVHARNCPGLHRNKTLRSVDWVFKLIGQSTKIDCSDGVLHIPAPRVLLAKSVGEAASSETKIWSPHSRGVNVCWFFPCHCSPSSSSPFCFAAASGQRVANASSFCDAASNECATRTQTEESANYTCFRGVHDGLVSAVEVEAALQLGAQLIRQGGDHFDIHHGHASLKLLGNRLPNLLVKLRRLLRETYHVDHTSKRMTPIAFRVSGAAPMDGADVRYGMDSLFQVLNLTRYTTWTRKCKRRNELARYAVPWPFSSLRPVRDTCNLMADMDADPDFHILTSVFLSSGAGQDFRGGVSLYVDHPTSRNDPPSYYRSLVRRGLTVDGSLGRIVVSTGGWENRRCRLPTRAGVRVELQIWWRCE